MSVPCTHHITTYRGRTPRRHAVLTASDGSDELAPEVACAHVVAALDGEVVLGVETEARHGVGVDAELQHVHVLVTARRLTAIPYAKVLRLPPVEARDPGKRDRVVSGVEDLRVEEGREKSCYYGRVQR